MKRKLRPEEHEEIARAIAAAIEWKRRAFTFRPQKASNRGAGLHNNPYSWSETSAAAAVIKKSSLTQCRSAHFMKCNRSRG